MKAALVLAAALSLSAPSLAEGQTWAVVVGIDNYAKEGIPALRYAGADAKLFAQALQTLLKVPQDHLYLFTSDSVESGQSPSRLNLVYRLDWLSKNARAEDVVIFYFAGHGAQVEGTSFLLTDDSDPRSLETLKASALNTADLNRLIDRTAAAKTLTVLDACRNNPSGGRDEYSVAAQFALTGKGKEVVGLVSCSPGQRSWEWEAKKHGFFTYFLVEAMQGKTGGIKGNITPASLAEFLDTQVPTQTLSVVRQKQNPRLFYDGPSSSGWVLGKAPASATPMKDLESLAARAELLAAEKVELESRLRAEEARRREVELRLEAADRKAASVGARPASEETQKLALARDLALKELVQTKKELETLRVQLAARGGPSAETELMLAEREQLRAENKVLLAKITLLEGRLQDSKVSMARSFTLEDNGPLSARAKELNALALHSPSPENRLLAAQADVAKDLYDADQLTEEVDRLTGVWFDELRRLERQLQAKESENAALREENERMHSELEVLGMVRSVYRNKQDQADLVKRLAQVQLASLDGSSPGLEATRAREQKALRECQEKNAQLIERLEALVKFAPAKRVYISRDFRRMNSMPGMGDILDIPVKTGPELQSLP
ncbi:MAG: caspase family protein [Candidatus Eremiobacteraeota bacterium]|nr:caspase family protein [Candidatus Eremiobacteraeota bacterium]